MGKETLGLSREENRRAVVLAAAERDGRTNAEIALALGLGVRQVQRLKGTLKKEGPVGLAHGNRGRRAAHALPEELVAQVVDLYEKRYLGFNFSHYHEKLTEVEGVSLSLTSVTRKLGDAGYRSPRKRRPPKHRSRRERREREGAMLQIDGSPHDWLGGRGARMCLVGAIDDATGKVVGAVFREYEDSQGYFLMMRQVIRKYGIPETLYRDRHGIFERDPKEEETLLEQFEGKREPTQFGRLLEELGVRQIAANSPQAKGRVERLWGTFQDRFVSELRLADACTMEEANELLAGAIKDHNRRFARKAEDPKSVWRKPDAGVDWESVFCFKYRRTVAKDNTIRLFGEHMQIPPGPGRRSFSGRQVQVQQRFSGSVRVYYQGECIAKTAAPKVPPSVIRVRRMNGCFAEECRWTAPKAASPKQETPAAVVEAKPRPVNKPAANHPWRRWAVT